MKNAAPEKPVKSPAAGDGIDSSLDFPGRTTLYPYECAERIRCTTNHIYDLIEEGKLVGIDISGRGNLSNRRCVRVPVEAWRAFLKSNRTDSL